MKMYIISFAISFLFFANAIQAQDNWNDQNPATRPQALAGHAMSFIGGDKIIVFGGGGISAFSDETWVYDLSDNSWTQKIQTIKPPARFAHAMAYLGDDKVLLFGGVQEDFSTSYGDTWVYDLSDNTWTLKNPTTSPSSRFSTAMASLGSGQVLLFGGNSSGYNGETWVYDLSINTWNLKTPATNPAPVSGNAMANIGGDKVVLFGSNWSYNDTWVYDLSDNNWTQKIPATAPIGRQAHTMASIGGDKVLLLGGLDNMGGGWLGDTWIYDLGDDTWTLKTPASNPSARQFHAMANIGGNKVLLFGGMCELCSGYVGEDTWLYASTEVPCTMTVSAGADENLYFGYAPDQCVTKNASVTNGTSPLTYSWTLDRALLSGETMTGAATSSVTICLLDTAELCLTVTDANGCTATDCAMIFAEDVRCFAGNTQNQKVKVCHNGNSICVSNDAVAAHIAHGDYVGSCTGNVNAQSELNIENDNKEGFIIYPNPGNGNFIISIDHSMNADYGTIHVLNMSGQLVKRLNVQQQNRISLNIKDRGVYIVQLLNGKETITKKLVVY